MLACTRELNFHFFDLLFSRTLFGPQNDPKIDPKMTPKFTIFASFLTPGPLPEPPGAILDALRALRELFGSSLKLLNHFKIHILSLLGALGTLLGPQERPKSPKCTQNAPKMSQTCPKIVPKLCQNCANVQSALWDNFGIIWELFWDHVRTIWGKCLAPSR